MLENKRDELDQPVGKYKRTNPELWHLTLTFLPDLKEEKLDALIHLVELCCERPPAGGFSTRCLKTFPEKKPTHLSACALPENPESWNEFVKRLRDFVSIIDSNIDRKPWTPHISIGRAAPRGSSLPSWSAKIGPIDWKTDRILLYRSNQSSQGTTYDVLHEFKLNV
ncbi:MAG: 2'-5' RNA ligase family protein [Patescibacteria group bacterium]|nr:2'-5' RNA ligase family protein [Patescibacteria group bacterium]